MAMKILIQDSRTSLFYKGDEGWTKMEQEAFDFDNTTLAERLCKERKFNTAQILVKFEQRIPDVRLACR